MIKNKNGVTLMELIAVIIVLGIISAISIPLIGRVINNSQTKADALSVLYLNQATYYLMNINPESISQFNSPLNDEERIQILIQSGYLSKEPSKQHADSDFFWNTDLKLWCNIVCINNQTIYDFESNLVDTDVFLYTEPDNWNSEDSYLLGSSGLVFIDNPKSTYTITLTAAIASGPVNNYYGGYGILFETFIETPAQLRDTGYALQFDRHYGQIIIRPRINGRERDPVLIYDILIDEFDNLIGFVERESGSNRIVRDSSWWLETHTIKLQVSENNDLKYLSVWIDGSLVFSNWLIENSIDSSSASINKTGLRAWSDVDVHFYSLIIDD
jgi:prepilin-type N-terminal cleavage/methylation domain-containing protein